MVHDLRVLNALGIHRQRQLEIIRSVNSPVHQRHVFMDRLYTAYDGIIISDFYGLLFYRHILRTG